MLEMGIGPSDLATVLHVHRANIHSRLNYMSRETCALFEALLVLPNRALYHPDASLIVTYPVPAMRGWHPCMREVLEAHPGEPYPGVDELFERCEEHARRIDGQAERGKEL